MSTTRQFKFRAWDNKSKRYRDNIPIIEAWWDSDTWDDAEQAMEAEHVIFDPANPLNTFGGRLTYEQWTGLTDSTGREIYEGDVVRVQDWTPKNPEVCDGESYVSGEQVGGVEYLAGTPVVGAGFCVVRRRRLGTVSYSSFDIPRWTDGTQRRWTVIGNIHQNRELLP